MPAVRTTWLWSLEAEVRRGPHTEESERMSVAADSASEAMMIFSEIVREQTRPRQAEPDEINFTTIERHQAVSHTVANGKTQDG